MSLFFQKYSIYNIFIDIQQQQKDSAPFHMDNNKEFDFGRNDRFYDFTIPTYTHVGDSVYYQIDLKDLVQGSKYTCSFRFNDFKLIHENLLKLKIELPEFPKTHLWKKTNKNPKMIEQRRSILEKYFNIILNDPFTRGCKDIKIFIKTCKSGNVVQRVYSLNKRKQQHSPRPKSLTRSNVSSNKITFKQNKK